MDWLSVGILMLFNAIGLVTLYYFRQKLLDIIAQNTWDYMMHQLSLEENQKAIAENVNNFVLEPLKMAAIGQLGGLKKGMNYAIKDMIKEGIDVAGGVPGLGDIALDQIPKEYRPLIPLVLSAMQKRGANPSSQGGEYKSRY